MVGRSRCRRRRSHCIWHLFVLGSVGQPELRVGAIPLAVLLAAVQAELVAAVTGVSHSWRAARVPRHVLLLPQGLLPGVFPRSSRVRRGRDPPRLSWRAQAVPVPEPPPVFHVLAPHFYRDPW